MVIATGAEEGGLVTCPLHDVETEHVAVEAERAVDVRHLEMDVPDVDARIDRLAHVAKLTGERGAGPSPRRGPWLRPPGPVAVHRGNTEHGERRQQCLYAAGH